MGTLPRTARRRTARARSARGWIAAALVPLLVGTAALAADPGTARTLEVRRWDDGRTVARLPLPADGAWMLSWRHSVTGILVRDYFRFERGRMVLEASHMPAFDAGLGHIPGRGTLESDGQGGYWVRDIDEPVPGGRFLVRVGDPGVNDHTLHAGERQVDLSALAARERVVVTVETAP